MEDFPGQLPEAKPTNNEKKDKKADKKRRGFNAPLSFLAEEKSVENKPAKKPSALDEALANLAITKNEAKNDTEKKPEDDTAKPETTPDQPVEASQTIIEESVVPLPETDTEKTTNPEEDLETWLAQEKDPNDLNAGEAIMLWDGNETVEERVIPLHAEQSAETTELPRPEAVVYSAQVEQQQQAHDETAPEQPPVEPAEVPTNSAELPPPPPPPERPTAAPEQPPEPPRQPAEMLTPLPEDVYAAPVARQADLAPYAPVTERPASKQDVEDAVYYATKAGQNKGLLTGLLVGGGYEHFKHKRREKRQEKRFKQQGIQLEQARKDYVFGAEAQAKRPVETNQRFTAVENPLSSTQKRFENATEPEKLTKPTVEQQPDGSEQLVVPAGHHLETSAWHNIEIDNKTGKPVENPAFQYGHEYYRERAQEAAPRDQRNATAGEVALVAASLSQSGGSSTNGTNPPTTGAIPSATTQGEPAVPQDKEQQPLLTPKSAGGPLWPWVTALVIIAILLVAVIR